VWPHGRYSGRRWALTHFTPTDTLYPAVRYGTHLPSSTRPYPTLGEVVCTKSPMKRFAHSVSDRGELMSSKCIIKPQHLCLKNCKSRDALRSTSPSPIGCFELTPAKVPKMSSPADFPHTRQEPLSIHPNTCIAKLIIYTRIYIV
jgi:hypothetical protein